MIAARLLQTKDAAEALDLYVDVIGSVLPVEELKKYEEVRDYSSDGYLKDISPICLIDSQLYIQLYIQFNFL